MVFRASGGFVVGVACCWTHLVMSHLQICFFLDSLTPSCCCLLSLPGDMGCCASNMQLPHSSACSLSPVIIPQWLKLQTSAQTKAARGRGKSNFPKSNQGRQMVSWRLFWRSLQFAGKFSLSNRSEQLVE